MLFPFVHQQQCGESLWIVIPYSERDKLYRLVYEMVSARAAWLARQSKKSKHQGKTRPVLAPSLPAVETATISRILLFSKNLFPPLSLLAKHEIQFYRIPLKAG